MFLRNNQTQTMLCLLAGGAKKGKVLTALFTVNVIKHIFVIASIKQTLVFVKAMGLIRLVHKRCFCH